MALSARKTDILIVSLGVAVGLMLAFRGRAEFVPAAVAGIILTGLLLFGGHHGN